MHHHAISDHTPRPFPTIFDRQQANSGTTLRAALVYLAAIVPKLMHWDSGKPCRLNSASATTAQQLRLSNYASATTPQQLRISNYASATTTQQPRLSNHGSATKLTLQQRLILHVISKFHPLWQVHARSHLTRHIKIPPRLASTCTVSSYTFTDLGLRSIVYEPCFTSHGLRIMVYEPWSTSHGLRIMVYEPWFTSHGLRIMVYEPWFTSHGLRSIVYEPWFTSHGLRSIVYEPWFTEAEVNPELPFGAEQFVLPHAGRS